MEGMKCLFPCLGVYVGGNEMVRRECSFLPFPSKPQIFVPLKIGGMGGNGFKFNEIFVKTPKIPL